MDKPDPMTAFEALYKIAATGTRSNDATPDLREAAFEALLTLHQKRGGSGLTGNITELARDTFKKSLIGSCFPNFWLEAPLIGEPGFDLHVYYDRGQVRPGTRFEAGAGFGIQALFDWYFGTELGGVGVGFAHDLRGGQRATGEYVNFNGKPLSDVHGFFERWVPTTPLSLCHMVPLPSKEEGKTALLMSCLPAFIKAKWVDGQPQPAKVYLQCSARPFAVA
jgi:hypothetical protein